MLSEYRAQNGQSVVDVCLNTYGTTAYMYKLLQDSGVSSVDSVPATGDVFYYDIALAVNSNTSRTKVMTPVRYATLANQDLTDLDSIFRNNYN
jgi:hypothetical protein